MGALQRFRQTSLEPVQQSVTEAVRFRAQEQMIIQAPVLQPLIEDMALLGADVSTRFTQTTCQSPDGTIIQEQSVNVWFSPRHSVSSDEARMKRLAAMRDLVSHMRKQP